MPDTKQPQATDHPTAGRRRKPASTSTRARGGEPDAGVDPPREIGGYDGPDPTRYGDWEHGGRCTDF